MDGRKIKFIKTSIPELLTPAMTSRRAGVIYLNTPYFNKLSDFEKKFVIQHEIGHIKNDSSNEFLADVYAFDMLQGTENQSLKKLVSTLHDTLNVKENKEHARRYEAMAKRALFTDYFIYKNNNKMVNTEKIKIQNLLLTIFANYLIELDIKDTEDLTVDEKQQIYDDFLKTEEVLVLENEINKLYPNKETDSFAFAALIPFLPAIGSVLGLGTAGLGVWGQNKENNVLAETERLRIEAEQLRLQAEAKAQQQKLLVGGGIGLLIVIIIVVIFAFRR